MGRQWRVWLTGLLLGLWIPVEEANAADRLAVKSFEFSGNTVFSSAELAGLLVKFIDRSLTAAELDEARRVVTMHYVNAGFVNSGCLLQAQKVKPMCQFLTSSGLSDEVLHIFYAEVDAQNLASQAGHQGESEQTFPFTLTLTQALAAVDSNAIYNGIVMVGLMWFARNRDQLVS